MLRHQTSARDGEPEGGASSGSGQPAAGTPAPAGQPSGAGGDATIQMTRDELNRQLADARKTAEREARESQEVKELQRKAARADELEAAQLSESERLTKERDTFKSRVAELEPVQERAERYKAALEKHLATQREGLPPAILALLDKQDPADQLEWLTENRASLVTAPADEKRVLPVPATPRPDGQRAVTDAERERRSAVLAKQARSWF